MMTCPHCQGKGLILKDNRAVVCICQKQKSKEKLNLQSGLPPFMQNYRFKNFNYGFYAGEKMDTSNGYNYLQAAKIIVQEARNFVKNCIRKPEDAGGLLISGNVGSGKTFLSGCIAHSLLENNCPVKFVVVPDLLDEIRSTYNSREISEQNLLEKVKNSRVLILDDLGAHNYTEWVQNKLYSLLNYRLNYQLPTVITTNIDLEFLQEYLGERTTSRIIQMCTACHLKVASDIRIVQRTEKDKRTEASF